MRFRVAAQQAASKPSVNAAGIQLQSLAEGLPKCMFWATNVRLHGAFQSRSMIINLDEMHLEVITLT